MKNFRFLISDSGRMWFCTPGTSGSASLHPSNCVPKQSICLALARAEYYPFAPAPTNNAAACSLGSARASRAGVGALAIANFSFGRALRRGAAMGTRGRVRSPDSLATPPACGTTLSCIALKTYQTEFGNEEVE